MAEDLGEKTEAPTSRRLEEAREKGQIAKSQDLASAIDLIGAAIVILLLGAFVANGMAEVVRRVLGDDSPLLDAEFAGELIRDVSIRAGLAVAPVLGIVVVIGIISHLLQVGPHFTTQPLVPNFERLNPVAGLGRLFGRRNLVKTLVNSLKLVLVLVVSYVVLQGAVAQVAAFPRLHLQGSLGVLGKLALELAAWLLVLLLVLGFIDYLFQRWQHTQDLRMTKEQVKDERRSMEGDPKVKAARSRLARQIALQRINQAVPKADVIVTNPTHFSVALKYDEATMRAPRVIAKGADYLAFRIRQVAAINRVPIVERPPLARALYAGCEVGEEIPPELYQAVAEVLAFVYRLESEAVA
ncbi:Flagellar biosynthetic protein FlhB [Phycisphaerales bacterium]|nr:Flagellar biosynthetic protein FlhB [Phycisphaerales bacterium]